MQGPGHRPRSRYPDVAHGTSHTPTVATWGPGDRPHPHGGHPGPRAPATPPWRPDRADGTGHAPQWSPKSQGTGLALTAAKRGPGDHPHPTVATQAPGDRPHPHGGHTGPRSGYGPTAARRGTGHWSRPHSGETGPRGSATPARLPPDLGDRTCPHGGHSGPRGLATSPRRPPVSQGTGHAPTASRRGSRNLPRSHGSQTGQKGPAMP